MAAKWNIDVRRTDNGYFCDPARVVPMQIRSPYSDLKVAELAEEMLRDGRQKDPGTVRRVDGVPHLLDGNRRLAAIKWIRKHHPELADKWQFWFVVQDVRSEVDAILTAATLNATMQMGPLDKAHMYSLALREGGTDMTQEILAKRVGKTAAHVSQHLSLLRLGEAEQRAIAAGKIGFAAALDLLGLSKESREQVVAAVESTEGGLTGQEVKELAAQARRAEPAPSADATGDTPPQGGGGGGKIVMGLGKLRKAFSALAEKDGTFLPIANVIDGFLRGDIDEEGLADEWGEFIAKLHYNYMEELKAKGLVRRS